MKLYYPLIFSAITIGLGTILLLNRVPIIITLGSVLDITLLLISSYFIYKNIKYSSLFGLIISVLQILGNSTDPTHLRALSEFGTTLYLSTLDVLMILSFYAFPLLYILLFSLQKLNKKEKI
ncbi:hypothetical protein [Stygiolobus caldivivus]|uniref:Uncharacterized protein n=1 Tax=Stygiolobus caldivivus TaxID=2824673 RepID=A0A8D5U4R4_9CREN|nr:hypothetical protein [Stygiolobus caldivivus]BCU69401.1 hypothetical protein KN1_06980 [Stygiolobus caldivivus]